jgi:hypothetical protein
MAKTVSNEECRLRLTDLAAEVRQTGVAIGVYAVAGQPRYQLAPEAALDPARVQSCVRIGPDKFRRHIGEYRGLALFDDIPFGLVIRGELVAVFQRDPGYDPAVIDEVRAEFARRQGKPSADLPSRIAVLEATVKRLGARLNEQLRVDSTTQRTQAPKKTRGKKPAGNADPGDGRGI